MISFFVVYLVIAFEGRVGKWSVSSHRSTSRLEFKASPVGAINLTDIEVKDLFDLFDILSISTSYALYDYGGFILRSSFYTV